MTKNSWKMRPSRILVLGGVWPYVDGSQEAANVVSFEIVRHLLADDGFDVAFCLMCTETQAVTKAAQAGLDSLVASGLELLPSIMVHSPTSRPWLDRILRHLFADPRRVFTACGASADLRERIAVWKADVVLTVWSEASTAACYGLTIPKFAYYGNPDHKVAEARARFEWDRTPFSFLALTRYLSRRLNVATVRRAHLKVMRTFDVVWDVAKNDADFYRANGVSSAHYINNIWPQRGNKDWAEYRGGHEQLSPAKIIASIGNLSATGNTLGFDTLVREVLPVLLRNLGDGNFELHIFGAHEAHPLVAKLLDDPHVKIRGFVDDLNAEILSSPVFIVANNHGYFKVGHTRFLHAWSLGACVVAFEDSAAAMPELVHDENCLLASSPDHFALLVMRTLNEPELRWRLGVAGQRTLEKCFDPAQVCARIADGLRNVMASHRISKS